MDKLCRPRIILNMALSLDGKIAPKPLSRVEFTSRTDRRLLHSLRRQVDALLLGARTLLLDNPPFQAELRALRIVFARNLERLDLQAHFFQDPQKEQSLNFASCLIVTPRGVQIPKALRAYEIWQMGVEDIDILQFLTALKQRGVESLLLEGGSYLNASFLKVGALDELYLTLAPMIFGHEAAPGLFSGNELLGNPGPVKLCLQAVEQQDSELFCHYLVEREAKSTFSKSP